MTEPKDRPDGPEPHFTVAEVAAFYQVCPRTVRNWVGDLTLRAWRKGRLIRIPQSALEEFDAKR
jgi:excisionase family DNA binding protein